MQERATELGPWAWLVAWVVVGLGAALGAVALDLPGSVDAHAGMHGYLLGQSLALGLIATLWAVLVGRVAPRSAFLGTAVLAVAVALWTVPADLVGPASRVAARTGGAPRGLAILGAVAVGVAVPIAEWLARRLGRSTLWRTMAIAFAASVGALNHFVLPARHPGVHLLLAWSAAALLAGSFVRLRWRSWRPPRGLLLGAALLAMVSVIVPPAPRTADLLAHASGCVLFPWRARLTAMAQASWQPAHAPPGPWLRARDEEPPVPTTDWPRPAAPVVVLLTIDALRADAMTNPTDEAATRALRALMDRSIAFSSARAPSTRTVATLASVFAGRHFSSLRWTVRDHAMTGVNFWPHDDPAPRLAGILSRAGVRTINVASTDYLVDGYGVVAGFQEDVVVPVSGRGIGPEREPPWAAAREVADVVIAQLGEVAGQDRPAFIFAHFLDAHDPYDQGDASPDADARGRWLAEVAVADAQVGRIVGSIDALGLANRATLIVTADHGEAFGEHGMPTHGNSLYDEILRVPLLVRAPGASPRSVDVPVSLLDLGPTILDLFGELTPGPWLGQSLLPIMRGDPPASLERPVVFEARPKQGLLRSDGIKVIRDLDLGTLEAYDLARDPGETYNLYDGTSEMREALFSELATFFSVHEHRESGYATPIR